MTERMREVVLYFDDVSVAEANRFATELRESLLETTSGVDVRLRREDEQAQDFGGTLVLVFGTPAVIVLAKGLADWLRKRNSASVTLKTTGGEIIATGLTSADARETIQNKLAPVSLRSSAKPEDGNSAHAG
jgi:hypothetical protein